MEEADGLLNSWDLTKVFHLRHSVSLKLVIDHNSPPGGKGFFPKFACFFICNFIYIFLSKLAKFICRSYIVEEKGKKKAKFLLLGHDYSAPC